MRNRVTFIKAWRLEGFTTRGLDMYYFAVTGKKMMGSFVEYVKSEY